MTKPTKEQVEAAKKLYAVSNPYSAHKALENIAAFLAQRDEKVRAEAKAEAFDQAKQKMRDRWELCNYLIAADSEQESKWREYRRAFSEAQDFMEEMADEARADALRKTEPVTDKAFDHMMEPSGKWPGICGRCGSDHKPIPEAKEPK